MSIESKNTSRQISHPPEKPAAKVDDKPTKPEQDKPVFRDWAAI